MPQKKLDKKYFWKGMSVDSIPPIIALLDAAKARMQASNLKLPGQQTLSKEAFVNALCLWVHQLIEERGVAWLENELRQPMARLNQMVAEDQRMREAWKLEKARAGEEKRREGMSEGQ